MRYTLPTRAVIGNAANAVVAFALHAFEIEFLCWTKDVNMEVAEFVWNAGGHNLDPDAFRAPGGDLSALVRALCRARREVPPEVGDVLLLNLDVHPEGFELVFTFDLSWDLGETFQACRIVAAIPIMDPADMN